jgi:DNA replication protein DnaC
LAGVQPEDQQWTARTLRVDAHNEAAVAVVNAYDPAGGRGLYLWGDVGTGKTTLAYALVRRLVLRGVDVRMATPAGWCALLAEAPPTALRFRARAYGVLVLDDLGTESRTQQGTVLEVVDARVRAGRPVICTGQLTFTEYAARFGDRGRALADRLDGHCRVVPLGGTSRRVAGADPA